MTRRRYLRWRREHRVRRRRASRAGVKRVRVCVLVTGTRVRTFHERRDAFLVFEGLRLFD